MKICLLASALLVLAPASASAVELVVEESWKHGVWAAYLLKVPDRGLRLCAMESISQDTTFRMMEHQGQYVIMFFNPGWSIEGPASTKFTINVSLTGGTSYVGSLDATGAGTTVTYSSNEPTRYSAIREMIGQATLLTLQDINGAVIVRYSGDGSAKALESVKGCLARLQ